MLSGVCVGSNDLGAAGSFYDKVLGALGMRRVVTGQHELGYAGSDNHVSVWVVTPFNDKPATYGNGAQLMFFAADQDVVKAFHAAALSEGGTDEGLPGPRAYREGYYGAYVRDPDGNKLHVAIRLED